MKVYAVDIDDGDPALHYATKKEALRMARGEVAAYKKRGATAVVVTVEAVTLVKMDKEAILRLINCGGGWIDESHIIATFRVDAGSRVGDNQRRRGAKHAKK